MLAAAFAVALMAAPLVGDWVAGQAWEPERGECEEAQAQVQVEGLEVEVSVGVLEMVSSYPQSWWPLAS